MKPPPKIERKPQFKDDPEPQTRGFHFIEEKMFCEGVSLAEIALRVGTPTYVYSSLQLMQNSRSFLDAFKDYPTLVCFAVKANSNIKILHDIFNEGLGADLVSEGELERALRAGCDPQKIVFSGVGKKTEEIEKALAKNILMFNVESPFEIKMIGCIAQKLGLRARISLRINPNINAQTHSKIATGLYSTKFGLQESVLPVILDEIKREPWLDLVGLSCHIGSQMTSLDPIREAAQRMAQLSLALSGQGFTLKYLDLGGGLGIPYTTEPVPGVASYAQAILHQVKHTGLNLIIEPGRSIVGDTGILMTRVIGVKEQGNQHFVILDAAMNDLMRPALYDSFHPIVGVHRSSTEDSPKVLCQFVGPICETGDILGTDRWVELPKEGDLFAITYAGAYGSSMSSQYNSRPRAAEVQVHSSQVNVIRYREKLEDLWDLEWQGGVTE